MAPAQDSPSRRHAVILKDMLRGLSHKDNTSVSMASSTGPRLASFTSSISFDAENEAITNDTYDNISQQLPQLRDTAKKYLRGKKDTDPGWYIDTDALKNAFPDFSQGGSSSSSSTDDSIASIEVGRGYHMPANKQVNHPAYEASDLKDDSSISERVFIGDHEVMYTPSPAMRQDPRNKKIPQKIPVKAPETAPSKKPHPKQRVFAPMPRKRGSEGSPNAAKTAQYSSSGNSWLTSVASGRSREEMRARVRDENDDSLHSIDDHEPTATFTNNSRSTRFGGMQPKQTTPEQQPIEAVAPQGRLFGSTPELVHYLLPGQDGTSAPQLAQSSSESTTPLGTPTAHLSPGSEFNGRKVVGYEPDHEMNFIQPYEHLVRELAYGSLPNDEVIILAALGAYQGNFSPRPDVVPPGLKESAMSAGERLDVANHRLSAKKSEIIDLLGGQERLARNVHDLLIKVKRLRNENVEIKEDNTKLHSQVEQLTVWREESEKRHQKKVAKWKRKLERQDAAVHTAEEMTQELFAICDAQGQPTNAVANYQGQNWGQPKENASIFAQDDYGDAPVNPANYKGQIWGQPKAPEKESVQSGSIDAVTNYQGQIWGQPKENASISTQDDYGDAPTNPANYKGQIWGQPKAPEKESVQSGAIDAVTNCQGQIWGQPKVGLKEPNLNGTNSQQVDSHQREASDDQSCPVATPRTVPAFRSTFEAIKAAALSHHRPSSRISELSSLTGSDSDESMTVSDSTDSFIDGEQMARLRVLYQQKVAQRDAQLGAAASVSHGEASDSPDQAHIEADSQEEKASEDGQLQNNEASWESESSKNEYSKDEFTGQFSVKAADSNQEKLLQDDGKDVSGASSQAGMPKSKDGAFSTIKEPARARSPIFKEGIFNPDQPIHKKAMDIFGDDFFENLRLANPDPQVRNNHVGSALPSDTNDVEPALTNFVALDHTAEVKDNIAKEARASCTGAHSNNDNNVGDESLSMAESAQDQAQAQVKQNTEARDFRLENKFPNNNNNDDTKNNNSGKTALPKHMTHPTASAPSKDKLPAKASLVKRKDHSKAHRRDGPAELTSDIIVPDITMHPNKANPVLSDTAQRVLEGLSSHPGDDCTVCVRATGSNDPVPQAAATKSDRKEKRKISKPVPVSLRMPELGEFDDEPTIRPSQPPAVALATVMVGLEDELAHLKANLSHYQEIYNIHDPSVTKHTRKALYKRIRKLLTGIDTKADQIYALYDVLEGQRSSGGEMTEEEVEVTLTSIGVSAGMSAGASGDSTSTSGSSDEELPWEGVEETT
ncbi:MAG: hypothetical protein M4579_003358 [Chaenotheca gracillima]|nr:MAG: hypothetical protein M4579_003358 [Chaenotheca gracillima]